MIFGVFKIVLMFFLFIVIVLKEKLNVWLLKGVLFNFKE